MSERSLKKFGPQIQPHLEDGERLLDVVPAIALKNAPKALSPQPEDPTTGTGATAARLLNEMPQRTSGVISVTDHRVLFFGTGFSRVKRMWWEIPRDAVTGATPAAKSMFFILFFADGSQAWFGGGHHDSDAIAAALKPPRPEPVDLSYKTRPQTGSGRPL